MSTQEPTAPTDHGPAATGEEAPMSITEVMDVSEDEFRNSIRSAHGCMVEQEVPCDLYTSMSAELVEKRDGTWHPTGKIANNRKQWGVQVRFTYYGNYEFSLAGRLKIAVWWDGFSNLPEGHRDADMITVDPCRAPHQYEVVIPIRDLRCPDHAGVYDIAVTVGLVSCGPESEPIVLGQCDLEAVRVTC